jgi:GTPase SAR1 family protein
VLGDVGGQKTLRTYWKNYFEKTDTLIWVVDSTDRERLADCRQELEGLLVQEVRIPQITRRTHSDNLPASHGGIAARLQEQKRRSRIYD